jgi:hypothetical protein
VVDDATALDRPRPTLLGPALDLRGQQLAQRLHAGEQPGRGLRLDLDAAPADLQLVALRAEARADVAEFQRDAGVPAIGHHGQPVAGRGPQDAGQVLADGLGAPVGPDHRVAGELETAVAVRCDRHGGRYHLGHA